MSASCPQASVISFSNLHCHYGHVSTVWPSKTNTPQQQKSPLAWHYPVQIQQKKKAFKWPFERLNTTFLGRVPCHPEMQFVW